MGVLFFGCCSFVLVSLIDQVLKALDECWVSASSWKTLTNRVLYRMHETAFDLPGVVSRVNFSMDQVWIRVNNIIFDRNSLDLLYLLVHHKSGEIL